MKESIVIFCPSISNLQKKISQKLNKILHNYAKLSNIRVIYYNFPYGLIPIELEDVYPLGQTEITSPIEEDSKEIISMTIIKYIRGSNFKKLIFFYDRSLLTKSLINWLKTTPRVILFDMESPNLYNDLKKLTTQLF